MTAADPFRLPASSFHVVNVSGGRSSGYMLRRILDAHGGALPSHARAIFCNTGKERPETLDFVARMQAEWSVPIVWLEYRYFRERAGGRKDPRVHYEIVNHNSASRRGEPFDQLLAQRVMLPNQAMRTCTAELKVRTIQRYMRREHGLKPGTKTRPAEYINLIGYRHDEWRRVQKALGRKDGCTSNWPMVEARVTKDDILRFWSGHRFDLGIPSWKGNCDLCFLKGKPTLLHTLRDEPGVAEWWNGWERRTATLAKKRGQRDGRMAFFSKRHSVQDLLDEAKATPIFPAIDDDESGVDCFCGD